MDIGSSPLTEVLTEGREAGTFLVLVALVVIVPALAVLAPEERRRRRGIVILAVLHLLMVPPVAFLRRDGGELYRDARLICVGLGATAGVLALGATVFVLLLPRVHLRTPRILQDVLVVSLAVVAILGIAGRAGVNLSGIIATSAVLTVIIGFALQDTLGNIFAGLALQLDDSFKVGDWVKVRDTSGRVKDIRWRYTAVETRNGETLVIPNTVLTREHVLILGRREGQPNQWRHAVFFNIDFRYQPPDVIDAVTGALRSAPIENVAATPEPDCILVDLGDSSCRYAVRYWLNDLVRDEPTDSLVRTRIYFALKRVGMPLSLPAHAIFVTEESPIRKAEKHREDDARRLAVITKTELFSKLSEEDRGTLAAGLRYAPFSRGETMTRQGAEAHWLYLIIEGEASVRVASDGQEREVARLREGSFFGEMSLMTGAPRSATVVAISDVECYRLDKAAFQAILKRQPEMAEHVAGVLAQRRMELEAVRLGLDQAGSQVRLAQAKKDLLGKMRTFFGLGDTPQKRSGSSIDLE